jgi:hypothetical protein
VLPPGGTLRVGFRLAAGTGALAARLSVDGQDVTDACDQRIAPTHPASRVELLYTPPGGWTPGEHEAAVDGDRWTFSVS